MVPKLRNKAGEAENNKMQDKPSYQKGSGHIKENKTVKLAKVRKGFKSMIYDSWSKNKAVGREEMKMKRTN